ncbi:MAG TPA: hypothetical protein VMF58_04890 [Rhizomicrobium sp.]|nr:hypothetical protein [Rhizomicrobium sp.]
MAALKAGWPTISPEYPDVEMTFFAGSAQAMESLELDGNALVATTDALRKRLKTTSSGLASIANDYDAYVICGLGLNGQAAGQVHRILRAGKKGSELSPDYQNKELPAALAEAVGRVKAIRILDMLRRITDAKILLIAQPLRAESDVPAENAPSRGMRWILSVFHSACEQLAKAHNATFMPQPLETLSDASVATKAKFLPSQARLSPDESREDRAHMNGEYGAIVLRHALDVLATAPKQDAPR